MMEMSGDRYAAGWARLRRQLLQARRANLAPPPKLTLSQWADRYAVLSRETSAQTGRFRAFPYQTGMMDAITDPSVTTVTVMKSARVGYTKILDHVVGYYLHQDPSPIVAPGGIDLQTPMVKSTGDMQDNYESNDRTMKGMRHVFNDHHHPVKNVQSGGSTVISDKPEEPQ